MMTERQFKLQTREDAREIFSYIGSLFGESESLDECLSVSFGEYKRNRSKAQNRLQMLWFKQAGAQGDMSPNEYRALCKLSIGVPLLRSQSETFQKKYDEIIVPLSYEHKLQLMVEPFDFPVTRLMSVKQMTFYLNEVSRYLSEQGIRLSHPDDLYYEAMGVKQ